MNNIVRDTRHGEVPDDSHHQENQVGGVIRAEKSIAILGDLLNVYPQHVFLNLREDGSEDVSHRQPKENIDVAGNPNGKRVLRPSKTDNPKMIGPSMARTIR